MDHGFVVFDNNAYKGISSDRLERILVAERDHGIVPLASLVVLQELLARVRDADKQTRGRNRAAIRKLGQHCRTTHDDRTSINFLSPVDSQVYHLLAGGQHPSDAEMFDAFGDMVRAVTEASSDDPLSAISDDLDGIKKIVALVEGELR